MSAQKLRRTRLLAVSAMLSALGVILLGVGAFFQTLDLSAAALASILCIYAVIELKGGYPWMIWGVTSLLGLLLLPQKSPALFYLFIGFYPIIKEKLERLPRTACALLKLAVFHALLALVLLVIKLFFPSELPQSMGWMLLAVYAIGILTFLLYDYALTKLITYYLLRLRARLGLKFK